MKITIATLATLLLAFTVACGPTAPDGPEPIESGFTSSSSGGTDSESSTSHSSSAGEVVDSTTGSLDDSGSSEDGAGTSGGSSSDGGVPTHLLLISFNIQEGGASILESGRVVAEFTNCSLDEDGYFTCSVELPVGAYIVQFNDLTGYVTPSDQPVEVVAGTQVYGTYLPE